MPRRDELEAMTVDDLQDLAAERAVEGRSSMRKADLIDALADGPAPLVDVLAPDDDDPLEIFAPATPAAPAGTLDPALAAARDATRAREAAQARPSAVTDPPTVVGADTFAAARQATLDAEARASGTVRNPPPRP